MLDSYLCQMNRQLAFTQTNGDFTKLILAVVLLYQWSYFCFDLQIPDSFYSQESIIIHGVYNYKTAHTKEKSNFQFQMCP